MAIDAGTGDGRAVLATAARDPGTLAIGLDPGAGAMAEASRRAARPVRRGGLPNALFVASTVEAASGPLGGIASTLTVHFPWASLLRGCLGFDGRVTASIAALLAPPGRLEILLAPAERDGLGPLPTEPDEVIAAVGAAFSGHGLAVAEGRLATAAEIRASRSRWAARLLRGSGDRRSGSPGATRSVVVVRLLAPSAGS